MDFERKEKNFFVRGEYLTVGLIIVLILTVFGGGIFLFQKVSSPANTGVPNPSPSQVLGVVATQIPQSTPKTQSGPVGPQGPTAKPTAKASPTKSPNPSVSTSPSPSPSASSSTDLTASCKGAPAEANIDEEVTWTAEATGGTGSYTYAWENDLSGTEREVKKKYSDAGEKDGKVKITSGDKSQTATCKVTVKSASPSPSPTPTATP